MRKNLEVGEARSLLDAKRRFQDQAPSVVSGGRLERWRVPSPIRFLAELGATVEGCFAIATALLTAATALLHHISPIADFIRFSEVFLVISAVCCALCALLTYKRIRNFQRLSESLEVETESLRQSLEVAGEQARALRATQAPLRTLAYERAFFERQMFERLLSLRADAHDAPHLIALTQAELNQYMDMALRASSDALTAYTGSPCAASVRTVVRWDAARGQVLSAKFATRYRDPRSAADRGRCDSVVHGITESTAMERVLLHDDLAWACDDVAALGAAYKDGQIGWADTYNAIIAVPIAGLRSESKGVNSCAVFVVDSQRGGFNNEDCKHLMRELSWQLAIILDKLVRLEILAQIDLELDGAERHRHWMDSS